MLLNIVSACAVCILYFSVLDKLSSLINSRAVILSKISFSFMAGFVLVQNGFSVAENGTLNYFIATAISLAALWLISFLYRSDWAVKFGTTLVVSYVVTFMVYGFLLGIIGAFVDIDVNKAWGSGAGYYVICIACVCFAIKQTIDEMRLFSENFLKREESKRGAMFDRVLASLIYGCSVALYLGMTVYGGNIDNIFAMIITIAIVSALAYVADVKLVERLRKEAEEADE